MRYTLHVGNVCQSRRNGCISSGRTTCVVNCVALGSVRRPTSTCPPSQHVDTKQCGPLTARGRSHINAWSSWSIHEKCSFYASINKSTIVVLNTCWPVFSCIRVAETARYKGDC